MAKYEVPKLAADRKKDLNDFIQTYVNEYGEFKEEGKKSAGSRAKKALTVVKKLITSVRRDIQEEINATKK